MSIVDVLGRYAEWVDFTADLMTRPSGRFPRAQVRSLLEQTFQTRVSWNWMNADGAFGFEMSRPVPGFPRETDLPEWERNLPKHPLICWFRVTGDPRPWSIGRVPRRLAPPSGFEAVRDLCQPFGFDQQLSIPYQLGRETHRAFVLAQTGEDFSDEDIDLARRLQPLIAAVGRQCALLQVPDGTAVPAGLTGRELAVLQLLRDGRTAHSIAHRLGISPRTVHTHLANTYRKLGVHDRLQAVLVAQELRLPSGSSEAPHPRVGYVHAPPEVDTSETVPGAYAVRANVG